MRSKSIAILAIILALAFAASYRADAQNPVRTVRVAVFSGATLYDMVTAAQVSCDVDNPCVIVFDLGIQKFPGENLPVPCSGCTWIDYRIVVPLPPAAIPAPSTSTAGGVLALACSGSQKVSAIGVDGIPVCTDDVSGSGGAPAGAVVMIVAGTCATTLGAGWAEETTLNGKFLLGTLEAAADIGGTGGADSVTPAGTVSQPTFTGTSSQSTSSDSAGTPAGTVAWPAGVPSFVGAAFSNIINHLHVVNITDTGHTHLTQRYPTATGSSTGFTIDTSMSGTLADNTLPTKTGTTGISATTNNPVGGVASITPGGTISWPAGVPTFSGSALATHGHTLTPAGTVSQPTFAGTSQENRPVFVKVIFCKKT